MSPSPATDDTVRGTSESASTSLPSPPAAAASLRVQAAIASETLFAGATEVQIAHRGAVYRLKQTALGKLILTK